MKVMFVIGTMGNGGAERVVSLLANCLSERGFDVVLATIFGGQTDYRLDARIDRKAVSCDGGVRRLAPLRRLSGLRRVMRSESPDCVVSFLAEVNIYAIAASAGCGIPLIISERNDPSRDPAQKLKRLLRDRLYRHCDGAVFQTREAREYFSGMLGSSCLQEIIYNPIKPDLPRKADWAATRRLITACRLDRQKNLPLMISAVSELIDEGCECTLDIYGRGPLHDDLQEYISSLGKAGRIRLAGFSGSVHDEMCKSDAFIISSDYEGLSNSMIEALAVGVPVIATDCPAGGAREFVSDGENGFLVPVNGKGELKDRIRHVLDGGCDTQKIADSANRIRETLSLDRIADQWIAAIEQVVSKYKG